jgi:hypothetical protein
MCLAGAVPKYASSWRSDIPWPNAPRPSAGCGGASLAGLQLGGKRRAVHPHLLFRALQVGGPGRALFLGQLVDALLRQRLRGHVGANHFGLELRDGQAQRQGQNAHIGVIWTEFHCEKQYTTMGEVVWSRVMTPLWEQPG